MRLIVVDIILKTITPATNFDLLTLDEAKTLLNISSSSEDAELSLQITTFSDVVATKCNRVFARETMRETVRCLQPNRYFVSHYPIATEADVTSVESPRGSVINPSAYEIELGSGKIEFITSGQSEPIVVTYTGGYSLPGSAPAALKQAVVILMREERMLVQQSAVAGVRALTHKESRVVFFDPNAAIARQSNVKTVNISAVDALLTSYTRIQC
jgi:hypothetical protein